MAVPDAKGKTLLQRLNAVQDEVDYVQKEKKAGMRYSIVSHDAVTAKVRPLMVKWGVLYFPWGMHMQQVGNRTEMTMMVRFVNIDDITDCIDVASAGFGIDESDKGPGKAISYSVKYALLKCLGLESGDDPDEEQDTVHKDPANPHNLAMAAFEADVDLCMSEQDLERVAAQHRVALEAATAVFPGRVQMARTYYKQRLAKIRGKTDGGN
jgi:hypothetical protein